MTSNRTNYSIIVTGNNYFQFPERLYLKTPNFSQIDRYYNFLIKACVTAVRPFTDLLAI